VVTILVFQGYLPVLALLNELTVLEFPCVLKLAGCLFARDMLPLEGTRTSGSSELSTVSLSLSA